MAFRLPRRRVVREVLHGLVEEGARVVRIDVLRGFARPAELGQRQPQVAPVFRVGGVEAVVVEAGQRGAGAGPVRGGVGRARSSRDAVVRGGGVNDVGGGVGGHVALDTAVFRTGPPPLRFRDAAGRLLALVTVQAGLPVGADASLRADVIVRVVAGDAADPIRARAALVTAALVHLLHVVDRLALPPPAGARTNTDRTDSSGRPGR